MMTMFYEKRYISKNENDSLNLFLIDENENTTLHQAIFEHDKIVLLGSPGIGKTTELRNLFDNLWDKKEDTGLIPFFLNIKYFRNTSRFEDLIPFKDWRKLQNVIFILDGLDEIADIQDFVSELELFISKNRDFQLKYVVSCRTNIYEKYLIKISDFETFFIKNLNQNQINSLLKKRHGFEHTKLNISPKIYSYLESPFFLNLFAKLYTQIGELPENEAAIWDLYVTEAINEHRAKQIKRSVINSHQLIIE